MPVAHINVEHSIPLEPAYPLIIAHIAGPEVDGVGRDRAWRSTLSSYEPQRAGNGALRLGRPERGLSQIASLRPLAIIAAEARSRFQRNADLTSRASSRIASRSAA